MNSLHVCVWVLYILTVLLGMDSSIWFLNFLESWSEFLQISSRCLTTLSHHISFPQVNCGWGLHWSTILKHKFPGPATPHDWRWAFNTHTPTCSLGLRAIVVLSIQQFRPSIVTTLPSDWPKSVRTRISLNADRICVYIYTTTRGNCTVRRLRDLNQLSLDAHEKQDTASSWRIFRKGKDWLTC